MNNFPFENLTDTQFEDLVIRVCKEILGIGCKTFSTGRDGAKDSWFTGTAQYFPSTASPWSGTFCIQAKHTTILNSSCSDNDFSVNTTSIISKEIKRLKEEIRERLQKRADELGIPNFVDMIADETIAKTEEEVLECITMKGHPCLTMESIL